MSYNLLREAIRAREGKEQSYEPTHEYMKCVTVTVGSSVEPADRPGYRWVQELNQPGSALQVFGPNCPKIADLPVLIGYGPKPPMRLQILFVDLSIVAELPEYDGSPYLGPHAQDHEWPDFYPGHDPTTVYPRAWSQLRVNPTDPASLSVEISPLTYPTATGPVTYSGGVEDLTSNVPGTTGQARLVLVYLDVTTNAIGTSNGAVGPAADGWMLDEPSLPNTAIPSALVRLENGQTTIVELDIMDRRLFLNAASSVVGSAGATDRLTYWLSVSELSSTAGITYDSATPALIFDDGTSESPRLTFIDQSDAEFTFYLEDFGGGSSIAHIVLPGATANQSLDFGDSGLSTLWSLLASGKLLLVSGDFDINGIADAIILDADGDTSISAPTDDQIDFEVGGVDHVIITSSPAGLGTSSLLYHIGDPDTYIAFSTDEITIYAGGVAFLQFQEGGEPDAAVFNPGEVIIDFRVSANGMADALLVDGSSGDVHCGRAVRINRGLWVGATGSDPDDNDVHIDGSINASTGLGARVYKDSATALTTATWTFIAFNQETFDDDTIHSTVSNTDRLTCVHAGTYVISASVSFATNGTNERALQIQLNGTTTIAATYQVACTNFNTKITLSTIYKLAASDYVRLGVYQNSGGDLDLEYITENSPYFSMVRIP